MNILILHKLFVAILFFAISIGASAHRRSIEVSAFYLHPIDMLKIDNLSTDYSINPIQLRIIDSFDRNIRMQDYSFQKIGNGLAAMAPDLIFTDMRIKTVKGCWKKVKNTDFGDNSGINELFSKITYMYSPGNDGSFGPNSLRNKNHYTPAIYTQYEKGNWYMKSDKENDTIDVFFNIDPLSFYIRTNYLGEVDDMGRLHVTIYPNEEDLDFYIFYKPAYQHFSKQINNGRNLDFLFENVNDSLCSMEPYNLEYYPTDNVARNRYDTVLKALNTVEDVFGTNFFPKEMKIVVNSQKNYMIGGTSTDNRVVFSMSRLQPKDLYGIVLLDHSALSSQTLIHELLHTGVPHISATNPQLFFFRESIIEYVASYLYNKEIDNSKDFFLDYEKEINKFSKKPSDIKLLLSNNQNSVSADFENSSFWVYYLYFPVQLHNYAKEKYDESKFITDMMEYIKGTPSDDLSLTSFSKFMKKKGYKNIEKNWNRIL